MTAHVAVTYIFMLRFDDMRTTVLSSIAIAMFYFVFAVPFLVYAQLVRYKPQLEFSWYKDHFESLYQDIEMKRYDHLGYSALFLIRRAFIPLVVVGLYNYPAF